MVSEKPRSARGSPPRILDQGESPLGGFVSSLLDQLQHLLDNAQRLGLRRRIRSCTLDSLDGYL